MQRQQFIRLSPNFLSVWSQYNGYGYTMVIVWSGPFIQIASNQPMKANFGGAFLDHLKSLFRAST